MREPSPYSDLANELRADRPSSDVIARALAIIEQGDAASLLRAIVGTHHTEPDQASALSETMTQLEALMDVSPRMAGVLMAKLYDPASEEFLHHICDAIGLWMNASTSRDLGTALRVESTRETDEEMKRKFLLWADWIDRNTSR